MNRIWLSPIVVGLLVILMVMVFAACSPEGNQGQTLPSVPSSAPAVEQEATMEQNAPETTLPTQPEDSGTEESTAQTTATTEATFPTDVPAQPTEPSIVPSVPNTESTEPTVDELPATSETLPEPTEVPSQPTEPIQSTIPPTEEPSQQLTYEEYLALTPAEQQLYFLSFPTPADYIAWYNSAKEAYEAQKDDIVIEGDGNVNIGDIINGLGGNG